MITLRYDYEIVKIDRTNRPPGVKNLKIEQHNEQEGILSLSLIFILIFIFNFNFFFRSLLSNLLIFLDTTICIKNNE